MSEEKESIHIHLSDMKKKEEIIANASSVEKYIILQNEEIHKRNKELVVENTNLKNSESELEDTIERLEKTRDGFRLLLKNFLSVDENREKIVNIYHIHDKENAKFLIKYKKDYRKQLRFFEVLAVLVFSLYIYHDMFLETFPVLVLFLINLFSQEFLICHLSLPSEKTRCDIVKNIENEIKKVSNTQEYLHELIDLQ